jgi:excinuclease UvrABC nuclease subunit
MSDKTYNVVYAFKDRDGNIRYIGKASCFENRMSGHERMVNMVNNPPPLYQWLSSGQEYTVDILYQGNSYEKVEKRLIKKHRKNGLYNIVYNDQPM